MNGYDSLINRDGFGVVSDEGLISGPFYTRQGAEDTRAKDDLTGESELHVAGVYHDHPEHEASACEECNAGNETDAEGDDE